MKKLKSKSKRGKFIVIYGANNLGKTTQLKLLARNIVENYRQLLVIKYPIYNIPSGIRINDALRSNKKLTNLQLQKLFAKNRRDFQNTLIEILNANINILAEDYTGTGIAWGMTMGIKFNSLKQINKGLIIPDLAILLDGKRFKSSIEKNHRHENAGNEIWKKNRKIHLELAEKFKWQIVNANRKIEVINKETWSLVSPVLESI